MNLTQQLQVLILFGAILLISGGFIILRKTAKFQNKWSANGSLAQEKQFVQPANMVHYVGLAAIIINTIGILSLAESGYGLLGLYLCLLVLLIACMSLTLGNNIYQMKKDNTTTKLEKRMYDLEMREIIPIQRNFKCCGIQKYTDYTGLWRLWRDPYEAGPRTEGKKFSGVVSFGDRKSRSKGFEELDRLNEQEVQEYEGSTRSNYPVFDKDGDSSQEEGDEMGEIGLDLTADQVQRIAIPFSRLMRVFRGSPLPVADKVIPRMIDDWMTVLYK